MRDARPSLAIYLPSLTGGGAERVMVSVANHIAGRGKRVDMVLANATGPFLAEVDPSVRVVDLRSGRVLTSLPGLVRYLRNRYPRVVLSTMTHANIIALLARRLAGVRIRVVVREAVHISTALQDESLLVKLITPTLVRMLYRDADAIVAPSHGVGADLARFAGVESDRIRVIFNPVDRARLLQLAAEPVSHPWLRTGEPPVLLAVGRLTAQKDYRTMIEAFAQVRRRRAVRLLILGEGPQRAELERLILSLRIASDVALLGFISNPFPYMRLAALFVQSSRYEGMPNALAQAVALGCKVVATDCPSGPREILDGRPTCKLVSVGDASALASAVQDMMDGPSEQGMDLVNNNLDPIHVMNRYCEVLGAEQSC